MLILKAFMLNLIVVYTASNHQIAIFRPMFEFIGNDESLLSLI